MPVDRPRRALLEEPDNLESYVAKRSRGFTQADSGDRIVVRAARAARALEPTAIGQLQTGEHDHLGVSGSRARRALPTESLSLDLDEDDRVPADTRTTGRRAIVDPEPTQSSQPALPAQPARALAELKVALEELRRPRRSAPSPPFEPAIERPTITASEVRTPDPKPVAQAAPPVAAAPPTPALQSGQAYRSAPPIDRPPAPLPQTPPVDRPAPALRQARAAAPISHGAGQNTQDASQNTQGAGRNTQGTGEIGHGAGRAQGAGQTAQGAAEITHAVPIRPASKVRATDRPATTLRPGSGQTVRRPAAPAVPRAKPSRPTVHHEVSPIIVDRLIKSYNGTLAVHNLSFVVEPGRVTGFLGPNGAGKTTTMRILLGLVTATTGTATFGRFAYADLPHPQQTVGCVLDARFHPGRSGRNHLRVLAPTAGANDRRVDELLGEVGLGEVARQPVGEYSMGMQQRLALAAAMLGDPDYLILDEPANGLDPEGIRWLRTFLRDFSASGRAVFISSHLLNEIEATADDIVVINRGRLLAQMPMSELNLGEGTTRARVSDLSAARQALAAIGADVEIAADERGAYLRVHSHDVGQVGSALFGSGILADELVTERRDLEQEFLSMLEGSR